MLLYANNLNTVQSTTTSIVLNVSWGENNIIYHFKNTTKLDIYIHVHDNLLLNSKDLNEWKTIQLHWVPLTLSKRVQKKLLVVSAVHCKRIFLQECIPVGCVPPTCYRTGGLPDRDRPRTKTPSWQRAPWTETSPGPPTPWTESQTGVKTLSSRNFVCGR